MLYGKKVWQKILFENILIAMSIVGITFVRVLSKIEYGIFGIYNILALALSFIGVAFIAYAKRDQLTKKDFFKIGITNPDNQNDNAFYRVGYFFFVLGLCLVFI